MDNKVAKQIINEALNILEFAMYKIRGERQSQSINETLI